MQKQSFHIVMRTPIGARCGSMTVQWGEKTVSGAMDILNHVEPFRGDIDESGRCRIRGRLISLTRAIPYTAMGTINHTALQLSLHGERNTFEVEGTPYEENGGMKL